MTRAVATIKKPSLSPITNSGQAVDAINKLTQAVQLFSGQHNDKLERAVTFKDLLRSGYDVSGLSTGGGTIVPPAVPEQNPDMSVPPPIRNFRLEVTLSQLLCFWDPAGYRNHAYVEVWIAEATKKVGTVDVPTVLSDGHFYGTCPTTAVGISGLPEDSIRVWARNVSSAGIPGPWHNEAGSVGTIPANPSYLIEKISGEIREGDLYPALGGRITDTEARSINNAASLVNHDFLIGAQGTELVQHGTALVNHDFLIGAQGTELAQHGTALAQHGTVLAQHGTQLDAANASISSLQTISTSHGSTIASMQTTLTAHDSSITSIQQISASQDATLISYGTRLNSHGDSIASIQQINASQDATLLLYSTQLTSHGNSIASVQQINASQDATLLLYGTQLSSHDSSITSIQQINETQNATLLSYGTTLASHGNSIISAQQINETQDATLISYGNQLSSQASSITSIQQLNETQNSSIASIQTTISSHGSSITNIQQINASQDATLLLYGTTLTSHSSSITSIQQINTNQDTTIATHGTLLNSHGSSITSIQQINTNQDTTIASHGTLLASHGSSITSIQQINTNQDTTIASHSTTLSSHGSSITSIQQINTNQDTTIASQGTLLSSHSSSIASLNSITTNHGNTLTSHGTTLSSYDTRISSQETINVQQGALVNAAYTLRIDSGGSVSGFGLMVDGATNRSQFIIRADQFAIAAPQAYDVNGAPIVQTAAFPFIVDVTNANDPKVLIKNAYISTAYIETLVAGKVNADYVNAMSLNAIKITGGQITIGNNFSVDVYGNMTCANAFFKGTTQSSNFVSGSAGWRLLNTGDAELNNAVVRGTVYANAGWFKGTVYAEKLVGGAYTRKVYQSDTVADFPGSNGAASAWYTAKRITVSRGMAVARVIDISGAYAHYTVATEHVGGSLPATFTATVKVGVRILRDGAYVAASTVVEIGLSDTIGAGSMATFVGGVGANLLATVPSDGATHYYDLQFRRELYGLVTSGVNASMTLGSNSSDSATAIMYIESGDLT